jgi:hypothetical protein
MTYSEAIDRIIKKTDEDFVGVSEDEAREFFREAIALMLKSGEYGSADVLTLIKEVDYTWDGTEAGIIDLGDVYALTPILRVDKVFPSVGDGEGVVYEEIDLNRYSQMTYATDLQPHADGSLRYFYVMGEIYTFLPGAAFVADTITYFRLMLGPPEYAGSPTANKWDDTTVMTDIFSLSFIYKAIEAAAGLLAQAVGS